MTQDEIVKAIMEEFNGRDVLKDAKARLDKMTKEELQELVLVACNKLGTVINGGDYEDPYEAALLISKSIDFVFQSYDDAKMHVLAESQGFMPVPNIGQA